MSAETKRALDDALNRHFADEWPGAYLDQYVVICYGQHLEDSSARYLRSWPTGQAPHVTAGLIDYAQQRTHGMIGTDT